MQTKDEKQIVIVLKYQKQMVRKQIKNSNVFAYL